MNKRFVESVYRTIVEEGKSTYKSLYEDTKISEKTIEYWKNAVTLYRSLNAEQQTIFMNILEQTMIDTVSGVFGVLDGSGTLSGGEFECDVKINGASTEEGLQDAFLAFVENRAKEEKLCAKLF